MMERWILKPLKSVGIIRFGMSRDDVHQALDKDYTEFTKNRFSENTSDNYDSFHVYYTRDNKVEAVEFFEGNEIVLDGTIIFPIKADTIDKVLLDIEREGNSYTHVEKSIGYEVNDDVAESILVGEAGYYDCQ